VKQTYGSDTQTRRTRPRGYDRTQAKQNQGRRYSGFWVFSPIRWWNIRKRISAFEAVFNAGNLTRNVVEVLQVNGASCLISFSLLLLPDSRFSPIPPRRHVLFQVLLREPILARRNLHPSGGVPNPFLTASASAKRFFTHFCSGCSLQGLN
jgi:hypothetical protein